MEPFVGEIRIFPWAWPPKGWLPCDGRLLPIQQNAALYSLLGIQYGGDGKTTFALPDLRGRVPVSMGISASGTVYRQGVMGGVEQAPVTTAQMPAHSHTAAAESGQGNAVAASGNFLATATSSGVTPPVLYVPTASAGQLTALASSAMSNTGSGAAHENRQPYLTISYCIATLGLYPPRQ